MVIWIQAKIRGKECWVGDIKQPSRKVTSVPNAILFVKKGRINNADHLNEKPIQKLWDKCTIFHKRVDGGYRISVERPIEVREKFTLVMLRRDGQVRGFVLDFGG